MIEKLILVRHGETVDNVRGVAQGWSDSALSERGREQIRALAARAAEFQPTAIYSSPLSRALTTAREIGELLSLDVVTIDDLRELNCGSWEGRAFTSVRESEPEAYQKWMNDMKSPCPGGESFFDVFQRVERALHTVRTSANSTSPRPLVVSHGMAIRVAATALLRLPLEAFRGFAQDNAAINVFDWRGDRFVLRVWNDANHCRVEGAA
jgi:broad specificity phosphatase PhoE